MPVASASRSALVTLAAAGAVGVAGAVWGIGIERHLYTLRTMSAAALPPGSAPVRVLHLSDAHMAPWQRRRQEWIARLAGLEPDLVINTGDNIGHPEGLARIRAAMAPFAGIPGGFVHGSNDVYAPVPRNPLRYFAGPSKGRSAEAELDIDAMDAFFTEQLGWQNLNNDAARVRVSDIAFDLFGVSDAHRGWDDLEILPERLAALGSDAGIRLGVTHAPYRRVLDAFTDLGAAALFAGHTHGGQVRLPGFGALVANCDIPLRQARGLSTWSHAGRTVPLHVSAGLGHSIFAPVRFACRPEATLLTLTARDSA